MIVVTNMIWINLSDDNHLALTRLFKQYQVTLLPKKQSIIHTLNPTHLNEPKLI